MQRIGKFYKIINFYMYNSYYIVGFLFFNKTVNWEMTDWEHKNK